jgi:hypothetical protein
LKVFRSECRPEQSDAAMVILDEDEAWERVGILSRAHAAETGCRTLDGLHVACALQLGAREIVTSGRQLAALARKAGLKLLNPVQ